MEKLTYRQAYDKIIDAYFKDEIRLNDPQFCFCGTLHAKGDWKFENGKYSKMEYGLIEIAIFSAFPEANRKQFNNNSSYYITLPDEEDILNYEEKLFSGMTAALEVLKQIHRDRGEDVDKVPGLVKRDLARTV